MRLNRLSHIKGYRIFRDFSWPQDLPDFAQFNLIYGWNGSGKTTLSGLLRCLEQKKAVEASEGSCSFVFDGAAVNSSSLGSATLPQVRVFNRDTVSRSVFEVPNQQLPPVYFLGEADAEKQRQIEALKLTTASLQTAIEAKESARGRLHKDMEADASARAREIKNLLTLAGGGSYNNYNAAMFREEVGRQVALSGAPAALTAKQRDKYLSLKDGNVKARVPVPRLEYPDLAAMTQAVQGVLSREVIASAIPELTSHPSKAQWVRQGLEWHDPGTNCVFCGQSVPEQRMAALRGHFNDAFKQLSSDIAGLRSTIRSAVQKLASVQLPSPDLLSRDLVGEYEASAEQLGLQTRVCIQYLEALDGSLNKKSEAPFAALQLGAFMGRSAKGGEERMVSIVFEAILSGLATLSGLIGKSEFARAVDVIERHNSYVENAAKEAAAARKALETEAIRQALPEIRKNREQLSSIEASVAELRDKKAGAQAEITRLEKAVRLHQRPAEELDRDMAAYLGRDELRFEVQDTGYTISRAGRPAMNLSEGERTAIAFMYFLKSLEDTGFGLSDGIVVIDDPVSSLDANSLFSAFGFMKARTKAANQLFVLTHSFEFFRQVRNWFQKLPGQRKSDISKHPARFYMLVGQYENGARCASLAPLDDLLQRYESEYQYLFKRIHDEAKGPIGAAGLESYYGIPNIARRLVEAFLAFRFPAITGDLHEKLERVEFDSAKKTRMLRFLHTHSHFDRVVEPDHDLSLLAETPQVLVDVLDLMKAEDPRHFAGMLEAAGG